jgi:hypothetical protein
LRMLGSASSMVVTGTFSKAIPRSSSKYPVA